MNKKAWESALRCATDLKGNTNLLLRLLFLFLLLLLLLDFAFWPFSCALLYFISKISMDEAALSLFPEVTNIFWKLWPSRSKSGPEGLRRILAHCAKVMMCFGVGGGGGEGRGVGGWLVGHSRAGRAADDPDLLCCYQYHRKAQQNKLISLFDFPFFPLESFNAPARHNSAKWPYEQAHARICISFSNNSLSKLLSLEQQWLLTGGRHPNVAQTSWNKPELRSLGGNFFICT